MSALVVRGTPRRLDVVIRPFVRALQLLVGGTASVVLLWFEAWWWAPAPLALSFLAYEAFFAARADRPVEVELTAERITLRDPALGRTRAVELDSLWAATLLHRPAIDDDRLTEVVAVLSGRDEVQLVLPLRVSAGGFQPRPEDVDAGVVDGALGGIAGLARALAPPERACRQFIHDDRVVDWLRAHLAPEGRARATVRLWRGHEPALDLFGYHTDPAAAALLLDGTGAGCRLELRPSQDAAIQPVEGPAVLRGVARTTRKVVLFAMDQGQAAQLAHELPLLLLDLEPVGRVAIPAPSVDPALPEAPLDDETWHLHAPEGAILLWHLARHGDVRALPPGIRAVLPVDAGPPGLSAPEGSPADGA